MQFLRIDSVGRSIECRLATARVGLQFDYPRTLLALPQFPRNRHSALISRIWSIVRACDSSSRGLATTKARHIAREIATLRRLRENRNSRLRGTSSTLDVAIE